MNIVVFDTETIGLDKPWAYNIGYVIYDTETGEILVAKDFVVEQIWHMTPLFETAYYADKRPLYVSRMRGKKCIMKKFGHITQEMVRDFKKYNVELAYAYNSSFDDRVFTFNCDRFMCINPFDNINILDIRGNVHNRIAFRDDFQNFCEQNNLFTDSGNYSTTAETVYRYISKNMEYTEEHTALSDSLDELRILEETIRLGCEYGKEYKTYSSIPRNVQRELVIKDNDVGMTYTFPYTKRKNKEKGNYIILN